jgi:hypothetical protein
MCTNYYSYILFHICTCNILHLTQFFLENLYFTVGFLKSTAQVARV